MAAGAQKLRSGPQSRLGNDKQGDDRNPQRFHGQRPANPAAAKSADALCLALKGLADNAAYCGGLPKKMAQERPPHLCQKRRHANPGTGEQEEAVRYRVVCLDRSYANSTCHTLDRTSKADEVLVVNY